MESVKVLLKKAKKGDGEAFVALVQQYEDVLYRMASRMLTNDEDVADAMQEEILSAYERLHTLKNDAYFNTWICKILINQCNSVLNKHNHFSTIDVDVLPEQLHDDFQKLELEDALNSLNKDYKIAFILYYIVGLNSKEIGAFLKEPEGNIKSRLSRGKTLLRNNYYKSEGVFINEN
ncbi:sigma-70 family RNA polymerase sigma factor [Sporosarcina sp. ANT_H38]|uniref:RNA polymerase sigma factor n=1 Tax=Sporosarcina sp. ANT_H38 TaxID=2597358 RepID=UPI0011F23EB1|nr:sigma-70 family RNA polymerase sigma factor [Sporosarcina sp. ANT_H38]KAA0965756.1 sigma-70 family RNA polymerase sigma factor [Sporosarcina sp. ANT_H38]